MDDLHSPAPAGRTGEDANPDTDQFPAVPDEKLLPHFIRAEANLLRLPLFALGTKGLKTLDGVECKGTITRDGQTHQFTLRATRNTATLYPGPLARAAHLAFLSLLTEQGLPLQNPVTWSWRDLCRRMRIEPSGWMVRCLKESISATAGLMLQSDSALYSKADGQFLHQQQDALHLYDQVTFFGSTLPDGRVADTNRLSLSPWYLNNLNALYAAPLDYELWRFLDERSNIASRLYEFVMINFHSGAPVLRINYETLAQFLPVRPERYRSHAQKQLQPALSLLQGTEVLANVEWAASRRGVSQLHLYRGHQLTAPANPSQSSLPFMDEEFPSTFSVRELRNTRSPEWLLVREFYRLWAGDEKVRPTKKELGIADDLIRNHSEAMMKKLLPVAVKLLKERWPDAKTFSALARYIPDALVDLQKTMKQDDRRRQEQLAVAKEREETAQKEKARATLRLIWDSFPESDKEDIRRAVIATQPPSVQKYPNVIESLCLQELSRRQDGAPD